MTRVYIETDASVASVSEAVGVSVPPSDGSPQGYPHRFAVDVRADNPLEVVRAALASAGIEANVYV